MKVLTLTTYEGYNYGASLQAYALQHYIESQGHEAELIRFEPEYLTWYYAFWYVNPDSKLSKNAVTRMIYRLMKWAHRRTTLKRKRLFDYFNHHVLKETTESYRSSQALMDNPPSADLYLCGSDQIWNILYEAGRDPIFYLDFVKQGKKASYAASFSFLDLPVEHFSRIQQSLKTFDAVSVREYQGKALVEQMGVECTWVLDPVFLLSPEDWQALVDREDIPSYYKDEALAGNYLLIYDFEGDEALRLFAQAYAKEHDLKIYAITDRFPLAYADRNFKNAGPVDFVRMIKGCSCMISNSFHGTVFSIIFHKEFYVFNRQKAKVNSRMESLLKMFCVEDRLIYGTENSHHRRLDWDIIEDRKKSYMETSKNYLKDLLK